MNSSLLRRVSVPILAAIFTFLFYRQQIAINLVLIEILFLGVLHILGELDLKNKLMQALLIGTTISAIAVVFNNSNFAKTVNMVSYVLLIGLVTAPELRSFFNIFRQGVFSLFGGIWLYFDQLGQSKKERTTGRFLRILSLLGLPILIVIGFVGLYAVASPYFNQFLDSIFTVINRLFGKFLKHINLGMLLLYFLGFFIAAFNFFRVKKEAIVIDDQRYPDDLHRKKQKNGNVKMLSLKKENQVSILLFGMLNIVIFVVIALDVYWVWINFSKNNYHLKQFVHGGTYLLILSILLSVGLVLYTFSANLNFYKNNRLLKNMVYVWLVQNAVLAVAVGIRNYRYIQYFGIAHKRIGLIAFLFLTIVGLWIVFTKVKSTKTFSFMERRFLFVVYIVFVGLSLLNWDSFIASYNIRHYETVVLDLPYLQTLNNKALPALDMSQNEQKILDAQLKLVEDDTKLKLQMKYFKAHYLRKKARFLKKYPQKSGLSWNWADYRAYHQLLPNNPE